MPEQDCEVGLLQGIPEGELDDFLAWRGRVRGANISEKTLLATDYLNHFNEIVGNVPLDVANLSWALLP